jgi:hypothetical protein
MKTKSTNTRAKKKNQKKHIKKINYIIPIAILFLVFYQNFLISQEFNHFYDIGSQNNYLSPDYRISEKIVEDTTYTNLTGHLVYFYVDIPNFSEEVKVQVRFKDNFPEGQKLELGARDQEDWHYTWHELYIPTQEEGWITRETTFNIQEENLTLNKNKLSLVLNSQHLGKEEYKNYTIPIDYINITVYKPALI